MGNLKIAGIKTNRLIGRIGELMGIYKLLELGYDNVFQDCGENNDIDLFAIKNKNIVRIQVKTGRYNKNNRAIFCLSNNKASRQKVSSNKSSFNKLLLVAFDKDFKSSFYLIPQEEIETIQTFAMGKSYKNNRYGKYKI